MVGWNPTLRLAAPVSRRAPPISWPPN